MDLGSIKEITHCVSLHVKLVALVDQTNIDKAGIIL